MSNASVILAWPDTFIPVSECAERVVSGLQASLDRKRAEFLDETADQLEAMARDNRELARQLRERAGQNASNENVLP